MEIKQKYSEARLDVLELEESDIITTSGGGDMTNDKDPNYDSDGWT